MSSNPPYGIPHSELLHNIADKLERQIDDPVNSDDPKWLKRNASKKRAKARRKEKAVEHKLAQSSK